MTSTTEAESTFLPCQACQLRPAQISDIFCNPCRTVISTYDAGPANISIILRVLGTLLVEGFLGICAALLVTGPILFTSTGGKPFFEILGVSILPALFVAPIIASLHAWSVNSYIQRAGEWGWVSAAPTLILTLTTTLIVIGADIRYSDISRPVFMLFTSGVTFLLGILTALWREHYLPFPKLRSQEWRRWAVRGWVIACTVQFLIGILTPNRDLGLFLSIAIGLSVYEIRAQLLVTRFTREMLIAREIQRKYRPVWRNQ